MTIFVRQEESTSTPVRRGVDLDCRSARFEDVSVPSARLPRVSSPVKEVFESILELVRKERYQFVDVGDLLLEQPGFYTLN